MLAIACLNIYVLLSLTLLALSCILRNVNAIATYISRAFTKDTSISSKMLAACGELYVAFSRMTCQGYEQEK